MIASSGNILPVEVLHTDGFALLASFVAVNSVLYLGLTVVKILPVPRIAWRGRDRRAETRSIYPDEPA